MGGEPRASCGVRYPVFRHSESRIRTTTGGRAARRRAAFLAVWFLEDFGIVGGGGGGRPGARRINGSFIVPFVPDEGEEEEAGRRAFFFVASRPIRRRPFSCSAARAPHARGSAGRHGVPPRTPDARGVPRRSAAFGNCKHGQGGESILGSLSFIPARTDDMPTTDGADMPHAPRHGVQWR